MTTREEREAFWEHEAAAEPVFHVKTDDIEFFSGWEAFLRWVTVWEPTRINVTAEFGSSDG